MKRTIVKPSNDFCPQTLFLYGTYAADEKPDFGLFCWFSYCWNGASDGLRVMACIGGEKMTKDNIRRTGVFSANLVTQAMMPLADYMGNTHGRDVSGKMDIPCAWTRGEKLAVPVLNDSPWVYELQVERTIALDDSDIFVCKPVCVQADDRLTDDALSIGERVKLAAPLLTTKHTYFALGDALCCWGEAQKEFKR